MSTPSCAEYFSHFPPAIACVVSVFLAVPAVISWKKLFFFPSWNSKLDQQLQSSQKPADLKPRQGGAWDWEGQPSWASMRRTSTEAPAFSSLFTVDSLQVSGRVFHRLWPNSHSGSRLGDCWFAATFAGWLWREESGTCFTAEASALGPRVWSSATAPSKAQVSPGSQDRTSLYKRTARNPERRPEPRCPVMEELGHPEKSSNFPQFTWKVFFFPN